MTHFKVQLQRYFPLKLQTPDEVADNDGGCATASLFYGRPCTHYPRHSTLSLRRVHDVLTMCSLVGRQSMSRWSITKRARHFYDFFFFSEVLSCVSKCEEMYYFVWSFIHTLGLRKAGAVRAWRKTYFFLLTVLYACLLATEMCAVCSWTK